jgi:hypothetical protein
MSFGFNVKNDEGFLQISSYPAFNFYKGTAASGTLPAGALFVRASNPAAGVYRNFKTSFIYTTDGGTFEFIRGVPVNLENIVSGFGLKVRNSGNYVVFESDMQYASIAFNKLVKHHKDWGLYTAALVAAKPNSKFYIDINSLGMGTYNRTLYSGTNAYVLVAYFGNNTLTLGQTLIYMYEGGSGNYTRETSNLVTILNA